MDVEFQGGFGLQNWAFWVCSPPPDLMRQIPIIAANAFMELVRQPVFLLLFTLSPIVCVGLALFDYFGFGGTTSGPVNLDLQMVKDGALTVVFLTGLAAAVLCATTSISREIETGTALAVLSKPVGRMHFLVGKYLGIIGALTVGGYLNLIGVLLASRMGHDAYTNFDIVGTITFLIFVGIAFVAGGLMNYFAHKPFVPTTFAYLTVAVTISFFVICAQDKTTAFYWIDSGAGIEASFWEIWKFTDTGGFYPPPPGSDAPPEVLQKLPEDKYFWQNVDFGVVQLTVLILFALWVIAAVAVACSTRLSWMPTMMICTAVFLLGMLSDYLLGEAAEGGGLMRPGEYVEFKPDGANSGMHEAFTVEPRGLRRLRDLQYRVRIHMGTVAYEGEMIEDDKITFDVGRMEVPKVEYSDLREGLRERLKLEWNAPLNRAMITTARQLMPGEFPPQPWERATYMDTPEFKAAEKQRLAELQARAASAGRDLTEAEQDFAADLLDTLRKEHEEAMVQELYLKMDEFESQLETGEYGAEESGLQGDALDEFKETQQETFKQFQYLRSQAQMETLPGQLAFWIRPLDGTVSKFDNGKRAVQEISNGSVMAKFLYVLLPNWQLFWLSDAVSPEEEELKVLRQDIEYKQGNVPWSYVLSSLAYVVLYVGLMMSAAFWLFEDRELS